MVTSDDDSVTDITLEGEDGSACSAGSVPVLCCRAALALLCCCRHPPATGMPQPLVKCVRPCHPPACNPL